MNLQECLNKLARGKLSNLSFCKNGEISKESIPQVVDAINEALSRLYTIFPIKEKTVLVEIEEGKTDYVLSSEHSWRNRKGDGNLWDRWDYYIIDTAANPFIDDILCIIEIWDDIERRRPLNDPDDPLGIMVPQENLIIVNASIKYRALNIAYRAKHLILTPDDLTSKVDIPENLYGALFSYVAYLIHSYMNTEQAVANAQKYLAEYQSIISEVNIQGTFTPDKLVSDMKFIRRGWV